MCGHLGDVLWFAFCVCEDKQIGGVCECWRPSVYVLTDGRRSSQKELISRVNIGEKISSNDKDQC